MKKYDEFGACVKCGNKVHITQYIQFDIHTFDNIEFDKTLFRVCKTCNYTWHELPLDYKTHVQ